MSIEFVVGTHTKLELVSANHGAIRVPLAQNFDYTPEFDERRLFEFDSAAAIAVVTNFTGVTISFDHFDSDSKLVDAVVNDIDPAGSVTVDDPSQYQDLHVILNVRRKSDNKIFQSILVKNARLNGAAASEPVREEATISRSGVATNALRIKGAAIEYARALRAGSTAFAQGSANSRADKTATLVTTNYEFDLDNDPVAVVAKDADLDGEKVIFALKNGEEYANFSITGTKTIQIPEADFTANDVFEFYTTYIDA